MCGCGCGVVECGGVSVRWWSAWMWVWGGGVWGCECEVVECMDVGVGWWSV